MNRICIEKQAPFLLENRFCIQPVITILVLTFVSLLMIFPFIIMVLTSFKTPQEINSTVFTFWPHEIQFAGYLKMFERGNWPRYFFNSVFLTTAITGISLLINSLAGYAFARIDFKGRNFLFILLLVGLMVPIQVEVLPVFIIIKNMPFFGGNDIFGHGGMGLVDSYLGIMLPLLSGAFGVFLCRQFYMSFPSALDEAAEIDGCSYLGTFFKIYLPQSKSLLLSLGIIKITAIWNDYMWTLVAVRSDNMKTLQLALAGLKSEIVQWDVLMAAATVVALPVIIVFLFNQRLFTQGVATSGIKN